MAEKVLGFKKKDAKYEQAVDGNMPEFAGDYIIDERKLVPVVSVEWLEKYCKENLKYAIEKADKNLRVEFSNKNSYPAIILVNDLLCAVKKPKEKSR